MNSCKFQNPPAAYPHTDDNDDDNFLFFRADEVASYFFVIFSCLVKDFEQRAFARDLVSSDQFLQLCTNYAKQSTEGEFQLQQSLVKLILDNAETGEFKSSPAMTMKFVLKCIFFSDLFCFAPPPSLSVVYASPPPVFFCPQLQIMSCNTVEQKVPLTTW